MKFLVDFDKPHYLTRVLPLSLPPVLMHYLLVINLPLPLIRGVIKVVVEVEVVGAEAVEVVVEQGGRGRGRGLCKCAYCHGENHTLDFC